MKQALYCVIWLMTMTLIVGIYFVVTDLIGMMLDHADDGERVRNIMNFAAVSYLAVKFTDYIVGKKA